jgi:hypothetical protein
MEKMKNIYKSFITKSERKRSFGNSRCTCKDNIKIDGRDIEWEGVDWITLSQDRDQWLAFVTRSTISFSVRSILHAVTAEEPVCALRQYIKAYCDKGLTTTKTNRSAIITNIRIIITNAVPDPSDNLCIRTEQQSPS